MLQELDRLVEVVDARVGGAVALGERGVARPQRVRSGPAVEVLHGRDVRPSRGDDHDAVVRVGLGEGVLLLALRGHRHAVGHGVVPARVEAREQAVPLALGEARLDAELGGDGARDLDVVSGEVAVLVMERPGAPGALGGEHHLAAVPDLGEQVPARIRGARGTGGRVPAVVPTAAGQPQRRRPGDGGQEAAAADLLDRHGSILSLGIFSFSPHG